MTADEARSHGDATDDQRRELRELIQVRAVAADWVQRFYASVRRAGGLSRLAATDALIYLRSLSPRGESPELALPTQAAAMRELVKTRIVPTPIARRMLRLYDTGELTYDRADLIISEWLRLPYRDYPLLEDGPANREAPDGYYALLAADSMPRAYRVHTRPGSGDVVVQQIFGEKPSQRRAVSRVVADRVMHEVAKDLPAAARLYGETLHRCSDCNSKLWDQTQPGFPHGYGPDCWAARQKTTDPAPQPTLAGAPQ